jgi:hypothetical protein
MTALGPATEAMTYLLIAPIICWLLAACWEEERWPVRSLYLLIYLLLLYPAFAGLFPGHSILRSPRLKSVQPIAALILLGVICLKQLRGTRQEIDRLESL